MRNKVTAVTYSRAIHPFSIKIQICQALLIQIYDIHRYMTEHIQMNTINCFHCPLILSQLCISPAFWH